MIVLMALGLVAIIAMVALVVEGGNAFAQQRMSQNGSDAAATAGALVVADELSRKSIDPSAGTPRTNADVYDAIQVSTTSNSVEFVDAEYTDDFGTPIGVAVTNNATPIPDGAEGVRVGTSRTAGTTFAGVLGISELRASADATVVAGALAGCPEGEICGVIPVTFPVAVSQCDGNDLVGIGAPIDTDGDGTPDTAYWPIIPIDTVSVANRAVVPLCGTGSGSVGWLSLNPDPGTNLDYEITNPSSDALDVPTWYQTNTGNMNNVENTINNLYADEIVLVPLFDGYCRVEPDGDALTDCPNPNAVGSNTWYHIPKFAAFLIDRVYIMGNNGPECEAAEGNPHVIVDWSGFEGCFTGWFVKYYTEGPIIPGGTLDADSAVGIQLIR